MNSPIRRIGIVAKRGLHAASEHLSRLETWLEAHGAEAVYETETALHLARTVLRVETRIPSRRPGSRA